MKLIAVVLVSVLAAGCQSRRVNSGPPASGAQQGSLASALTAHVWSSTDSSAAPGTILSFTEDGTLLMDSCFETYRLCRWSMASDSVVAWQEDTANIHATLVSADAKHLVLRLALAGGVVEQHFTAASVPFTCPDMPKR